LADFPNIQLTNKGLALQAKAQIGTQLQFTRSGIGDGTLEPEQEIKDLNVLISEKKTLDIGDMSVIGDGTVRIRIYVTNEDLAEGFFVREIGIFANDPDEGEILYCYTNAGAFADYLPADQGSTVIESIHNITTTIGEAENVSITVESGIYVTQQDFNVHKNDKATDAALGHVKVDGNTITIDENGIISAGTPGTFRYGIKIDKNDSNPFTRVEYLYDAVGMIPAGMNYSADEFNYGSWRGFCEWINTPVMLNYDGTVAYRLDRNDQTKKADGTASDIGSTAFAGNAMSQFKRLWIKEWEDATHEYIVFSNVQYDSSYHAHAFTDENGNIQDYMYKAMFDGSYVAPRLRSLATGAVMASQTGQIEIERAEENGIGWHIGYKSQRDYITYLLWLIGKTTADQLTFGNGNSDSGVYIAPGALKGKGQFHGYSTTTQAVKVFYIENYWGNYWERMSGMLLALNGEIHVRKTPPYLQPATPDENVMPAGYTPTGVFPTGGSGGYLRDAKIVEDLGFIPDTNGASATTYYTCGLWYAVGGTIKWALVSGARGYGSLCGAGTVTVSNPLSLATSNFGASLSFLEKTS